METEHIKISGCIDICPFYQVAMDGMDCGHPFFEDKGAFDNMIITQDNGKDGKIPPKCPLRKKPFKSRVIYSLSQD